MERKEYSAGAVKHSFWFVEFRNEVKLLLQAPEVFNKILWVKDAVHAMAYASHVGTCKGRDVSSHGTWLDACNRKSETELFDCHG